MEELSRNTEALEALLKRTNSLPWYSWYSWSPWYSSDSLNRLWFEVAYDDNLVGAAMLANGVDINVADKNGFHALGRAKSAEMAQLMLDYGADIETRDQTMPTMPMMGIAIMYYSIDMVVVYMKRGANIDAMFQPKSMFYVVITTPEFGFISDPQIKHRFDQFKRMCTLLILQQAISVPRLCNDAGLRQLHGTWLIRVLGDFL